MNATHHEPRTGAVEPLTSPPACSRVRPVPPDPTPPSVHYAWTFEVIDFAGHLTSAQVVVTRSGLIVVSTPDGGSFAVDPDDQFAALSAALRQARQLALTNRERSLTHGKHRKDHRHG
jgi:hypothetical protein